MKKPFSCSECGPSIEGIKTMLLVCKSEFYVEVGSAVHQEAKVISPDFLQPRVNQGMISLFLVCLWWLILVWHETMFHKI